MITRITKFLENPLGYMREVESATQGGSSESAGDSRSVGGGSSSSDHDDRTRNDSNDNNNNDEAEEDDWEPSTPNTGIYGDDWEAPSVGGGTSGSSWGGSNNDNNDNYIDRSGDIVEVGWESVGEDGRVLGVSPTLEDYGDVNYDKYGNRIYDSAIEAKYNSLEYDKLADEAWTNGDYGDWLSYSLQSFGSGFVGDMGENFTSLTNSPLDFAADLSRTGIARVAVAMTGPAAMLGAYGLQSIDGIADYFQGDLTGRQVLGQSLVDTGAFVGGTLGGMAAGAGYGVNRDYSASGAAFGSLLGQGTYLSPIASAIGGIIGENFDGAGAGGGPQDIDWGGGSDRDYDNKNISGGYDVATSGSGGGGESYYTPQKMTTPLEDLMMSYQDTSKIGISSDGVDNLSIGESIRGGMSESSVGRYTPPSDRYSTQVAGLPTSGQSDGGVIEGAVPAQETGIISGNAINNPASASTGIFVNVDPELVDTSRWSYVTESGIINA